jgi:hypothetical protein
MSGLTCQQIAFRDETCAERKSQRGLWLGVNPFAAYDLDRPIAFGLICDRINADGGNNPRFRKALLFYRGEQ